MKLKRFRGTPFFLLLTYWPRVQEGIVHDVRLRYGGSVLGCFWAFLAPFMQLSIYSILYTFVFRVRPEGLGTSGYILLVFSGLVPLLAFNDCLLASMNSLSANASLLLNNVVPAELIPLRAGLAAQIPLMTGILITYFLSLALGKSYWAAPLLATILWLLLLMFAIGIGWLLSLVTLVAKDLQHSIGLLTMLLFISSPFAYTPDMVPSAMKFLIWFNPLTYFVLSFQSVLCFGSLPGLQAIVGVITLSFVAFFGGFYVFQRSKGVFFDYA